jgi:hypothetical protein
VTVPHDHCGDRVTTAEIRDLIGWMRRLSNAGIGQADPAELAAFHAAKQDLITRIGHHTPTAMTTSQEPTP